MRYNETLLSSRVTVEVRDNIQVLLSPPPTRNHLVWRLFSRPLLSKRGKRHGFHRKTTVVEKKESENGAAAAALISYAMD